MVPGIAVVAIISTILALHPPGETRQAGKLDIASMETAIRDAELLDEAVSGLAALYQKDFPHEKVDSVVQALMKEKDVSAYEATKALIRHLQESSPDHATDLQAELLYWVSRSRRTYDNKCWGADREAVEKKTFKQIEDYADIEEFGKLAMNWIHHEDPFVRALTEWAIANRVSVLNSGSLETWPEDENKASDWYHVWKDLLGTGFVLEADYVRQGVRKDMHRSSGDILADAEKMIDRAGSIHERINTKGNKEARSRARKWTDKLLDQYEKLEAAAEEAPGELTAQRKIWLAMRKTAREIVLNNPDTDFDKILFALRYRAHMGGNITNGGKSYNYKPGGDIYIREGFDPSADMQPLIGDKLPPGHMQGMDLSFDAGRVVVSYVKQPRYFEELMWENEQGFTDLVHGLSGPASLFEIDIKENSVRQLTNHPYNHDIEPAYLPNGDIVFASTRSDFGSQCSGSFDQNKKITNMYLMNGDGENIRSLSNNKDFDRYPHVMNNGKIVYTRWEYQQRDFYQPHNLWACRPDGSFREALYKQHNLKCEQRDWPMSFRDARAIPNSDKLVAIGTGHHTWAQGAVYLIDYQKGINEPDGYRIVTPEIGRVEGGLGDMRIVGEGGVIDYGGLYQQPFALSEKSFLASYTYDRGPFALYYIDVWGNKELICRDPVLSVAYPILLKEREKPTELSGTGENPAPYATVYMVDIYQGVPELKKGDVKYIRIGHHTESPAHERTGDRVVDFNHFHYPPFGSWMPSVGNWTWSPSRVIGTVPVEEDGSSHFKVPADIPVYFQALDEDYREIRRMRSFISFRPGEIRGCTGCHESRDETPFTRIYETHKVPSAVRREPSTPDPPAWGDRELPDFERDIQPIFTRHCASCHGAESPKAGLDFSARRFDGLNQAYRTLFGLRPNESTPIFSFRPEIYKLMYPDFQYTYRNGMQDRDMISKMSVNEYPGQLLSISNKMDDNSVSQVKEFGSTRSRLIRAIQGEAHRQRVDMSREEWRSLVTWIDLNAPYWGSFWDKEPLRNGEKPKRVFVLYPEPFASPDYAGTEVIGKTSDY